MASCKYCGNTLKRNERTVCNCCSQKRKFVRELVATCQLVKAEKEKRDVQMQRM